MFAAKKEGTYKKREGIQDQSLVFPHTYFNPYDKPFLQYLIYDLCGCSNRCFSTHISQVT